MATATQQLHGTFATDPAHSSFQFAIKHMSVSTFRAAFSDVEARLDGSDDAGFSLAGRARVESISIVNPPPFREHVVNGADFFDAVNHPFIAFRSNDVQLAVDGTVSVAGELEIRGTSRALMAAGTYQEPVEDPYGGLRTAIELTATVDRRDWGMDWQMALPKGGDALGYEVELTVHLELVKQA